MREAFAELQTVQQKRFQIGQPPMETSTDGFLDYKDDEMHQLVLKLNELVPPHRELLLQVVRGQPDAVVRAEAATLLNWAAEPHDSLRSRRMVRQSGQAGCSSSCGGCAR